MVTKVHKGNKKDKASKQRHTYRFTLTLGSVSTELFVALPPSLALLQLSNRNCCWLQRSNMGRLRGRLAS